MKLGNFIEVLIKIITLGQGKKIATYVAKLRGKEDCGCHKRKEILNNISFTSMEHTEKQFTLDWSSKWKEIRNQVSCSCEFDYAILLVKDKVGGVIHEEKISAIPYMNGQVQKKNLQLPSFLSPHSFSLKFHKKEENQYINPVNINL